MRTLVVYGRTMPEPRSVSTGWRHVGMFWDGDHFDLEGVNPWEHEWVAQEERIVVAHPSYPDQRHDADVWVIRTSDRVVRFAAGEMSALAWAFFLPTYS